MELQAYEKKHLELLRTHLCECAVLLKSNGDFPLSGPCKLALYGSGACHTVKGGTGSGEVNSRFFISVEKGLREAGFMITSYPWLNAYDRILKEAHRRFVQEIRERAKKNHTMAVNEGMGAVMPEPDYEIPLDGEGDTAVYVLSRISGEGNDRKFEQGDILLSETEVRDILAAKRKYRRFMLMLNVGGPVDLNPVAEVENILILSQLGVETGRVAADLLLGKAYPSGKLTTSWAAAEAYPKIGEFGNMNETRYREGIYVGYRYFDSASVRPAYPFGFGLGYTEFTVSDIDVALEGESLSVQASVRNTGARTGKEVLQLYVSKPQGDLDQPFQSLAAFAKSKELAPQEAERLSLRCRLSELASYDQGKAAWLLEKGNYLFRLGTSSRDTDLCAVVELPETVLVAQLKNCLGKPDFADWRPEKAAEPTIPEEIPHFSADPAAISKTLVDYEPIRSVDPLIKGLTDQELAYLNVGAFNPKGGIMSVIGSASSSVAGAAGETAGTLKAKAVPALVMADGPAGLRLSRDYIEDESGAHSVGPTLPETMAEFLPKPAQLLLKLTEKKPDKHHQLLHQYCTAIPIGTALAQSWNLDFAKLCGDLVGAEMQRFGIHLWLAPALNIHRDIRCGRNFEYFSEDPLISGLFAAAITEGVQAHPGCGTTIKHFAANNQETNRYNSNSQVSERAMREIYLKGFEICVKQAQPHALMTSYNLLNGIHTSERRDLTEDILRCEFGYQGIVMTDWVILGMSNKASVHPNPHAGNVAAAGGDLFMPGSKRDYQDVLDALSDGRLSRQQLEINASRVYRMAKALAEPKKS